MRYGEPEDVSRECDTTSKRARKKAAWKGWIAGVSMEDHPPINSIEADELRRITRKFYQLGVDAVQKYRRALKHYEYQRRTVGIGNR